MGKARSTSKPPKSAPRTTIEDVKARLRQLIEDNAGIPADSVRDDSTFDEDLAMDSFSLLSVQVAVEETFEITFEVSDLEERNRFDAIAELVLKRTRAKTGSPARQSAGGSKGRSKVSRTKGS